MKENSRLQAAIELLDAIGATGRPADRVVDRYLKDRRYIGSGDRSQITRRVWGVVRRQFRLDWWIKNHARRLGRDGRGLILADLALSDGMNEAAVAKLFDGSRHAPDQLLKDEAVALKRLVGQSLDHADMPDAVRLECPTGLWPAMQTVFGEEIEAGLKALGEEAPFYIRVNPLRGMPRERVVEVLAAQTITAEPAPLSPLGLRLDRRRPVDGWEIFKDGAVEVQDEGSQLAALLVDARPGQTVVDYCARAGGKSLVLAAQMRNKGRLLSLDTSEGRLKRAATRFRRSGVQNAERRVLKRATRPSTPVRKGPARSGRRTLYRNRNVAPDPDARQRAAGGTGKTPRSG